MLCSARNEAAPTWFAVPVLTAIVATGIFGFEPAAAASKAQRRVLDNGMTILMLPIPQADQVAVVAFYHVGFLHEPKGMTQAAHLLEHLVCHAATKSYGRNEAMNLLNRLGMANAETLPDWTHYDYVLPSDKLGLAIQIEAERLTSLRIDEDIIAVEAPRCYRETDIVEQNPAAGMIKHAFMAFNQAWRHGATDALVRGGLENLSIDDLAGFHRRFYRPDNLTLILVGGFEADHALKLLEKHLGGIRPEGTARLAAIDWPKVPRRMTVQWDAKLRGVCIAFPPPDDQGDCLVLSLLGSVLAQKLTTDSEIGKVADSVFCSNFQWGVGEMPLFIYAAAKPEAALKEVEDAVARRAQQIFTDLPDYAPMQMRMAAAQLSQQASILDWASVQTMARLVARQRGGNLRSGTAMVLGQSAINWGVADRLLGPKPSESVSQLSSLTGAKLRRLVARCLDPSRQFVTLLAAEPSR